MECPAASAGLLVRLDLADNTLGEEGGSALAEALSSQPGLTYVNLRDCNLEVSRAGQRAEPSNLQALKS